jgi:NAD(P)-dependent dehydrogenase (short-subunit alcohol dehydrogenase family)
MDLRLSGKRALVTGSTSGIGVGIARALAAEGVAVVVHGRDAARAGKVAADLRGSGVRVGVALGDLASDEGAAAVAKAATEALGGIDILVNNAGGQAQQSAAGFDNKTPDDWLATYNNNAVAALRLIHLLSPAMKERGWGRIIQIASAAASAPSETVPQYSASKAAIVNLTVSLSKALTLTGVTANTVSPGMIATPALDGWLDGIAQAEGFGADRARTEAYVAENLVQQTVGRIGQPHDIGAMVAFLASPLADFINGANFRVDGGCSPSVN